MVSTLYSPLIGLLAQSHDESKDKMADIGKSNSLRVVKQVDFGLYLDGGDLGEILMPVRYVPEDWDIDDYLDVFVYLDSEDRPIATTELPRVQVGECAHLNVIEVGKFGAFLDWGVAKDLLVPFKEQRVPMQEGKAYTVYLYIDKSGRIAASSKLSAHLQEESDGIFIAGEEVLLQIASRTELGYKAVINGTHLGLVHNSEILNPIRVGETLGGYIHSIRPDGLINLTFHPKSHEKRTELSLDILEHLEDNGGQSLVTEKSGAAEIQKIFGCSKSSFKKAIGKLYKDRKIKIESGKITLL